MNDETEAYRRARVGELNQYPSEELERREALEAEHGQVWTTPEMRSAFEVIGFAAPFVVVKERVTGKRGTLEFTHMPRFYFNWVEDK